MVLHISMLFVIHTDCQGLAQYPAGYWTCCCNCGKNISLCCWCPACFAPCSDKSVIVWHLERSETQYGFPKRSLIGHNHYVQVSHSSFSHSSRGSYAASSRPARGTSSAAGSAIEQMGSAQHWPRHSATLHADQHTTIWRAASPTQHNQALRGGAQHSILAPPPPNRLYTLCRCGHTRLMWAYQTYKYCTNLQQQGIRPGRDSSCQAGSWTHRVSARSAPLHAYPSTGPVLTSCAFFPCNFLALFPAGRGHQL